MKYNFDEVNNRIGTYSTQWDFIADRFGRNDILPFSISDTDFIIPYEVTEALKKASEMQIFGYTRWNHDDFRNSIINYYDRRFETDIKKEWIVYSPSVMYALSSLIELLTKENDTVAAFSPMYTDFEDCTLRRNRKMHRVLLEDKDGRYEINFEVLEEALKEAKLFLLCSPHNPTGRVFQTWELLEIMELCKAYHVPIVCDEIHMDMVLSGRHFPLMYFYDEYQDIYSISSGSKTFNYPSLGGSYALIPNEKIRAAFLDHTKHRDFVNSANFMGMTALMTSYTKCDDYIEEVVEYIRGNMAFVKNFIDKHCQPLKFTIPEGSYLAWIDVHDLKVDADTLQDILVNTAKVGIMKGETYFGDGYLRMNVGCPRSKVEEGLKRIKLAVDLILKKQKEEKAKLPQQYDLVYCFEEALKRIREEVPEATNMCINGQYQIGYWNNRQAYINIEAVYDEPGIWYPGLVGYTDEEMIEQLVNVGLEYYHPAPDFEFDD